MQKAWSQSKGRGIHCWSVVVQDRLLAAVEKKSRHRWWCDSLGLQLKFSMALWVSFKDDLLDSHPTSYNSATPTPFCLCLSLSLSLSLPLPTCHFVSFLTFSLLFWGLVLLGDLGLDLVACRGSKGSNGGCDGCGICGVEWLWFWFRIWEAP